MGAFGGGEWDDVMTRKVNTRLYRTFSVKTSKKIGVFDADGSDDRYCIRWGNEFGEDAGMVTITREGGGNRNVKSSKKQSRI